MLSTATASLGKNHYALLGRLLVATRTDLALELLHLYSCDTASETDHQRMAGYFSQFCKQQFITPSELTGALLKSHKVEKRRLFIAAMLRLYAPQAYRQPAENIILRRGFVATLAGILRCHNSNLHKTIREVVLWENEYDDFRESVDKVVAGIKEVGHG